MKEKSCNNEKEDEKDWSSHLNHKNLFTVLSHSSFSWWQHNTIQRLSLSLSFSDPHYCQHCKLHYRRCELHTPASAQLNTRKWLCSSHTMPMIRTIKATQLHHRLNLFKFPTRVCLTLPWLSILLPLKKIPLWKPGLISLTHCFKELETTNDGYTLKASFINFILFLSMQSNLINNHRCIKLAELMIKVCLQQACCVWRWMCRLRNGAFIPF